MQARRGELIEGEDYYREGATLVFTAGYHLRRGSCCGSGCRHCPFGAGTGEETKGVNGEGGGECPEAS
jgi:hypothetical protein